MKQPDITVQRGTLMNHPDGLPIREYLDALYADERTDALLRALVAPLDTWIFGWMIEGEQRCLIGHLEDWYQAGEARGSIVARSPLGHELLRRRAMRAFDSVSELYGVRMTVRAIQKYIGPLLIAHGKGSVS